tara:strand:+ start:685 stop:819 length:135 start_codon:yes stop_codon:yes gene_type:complete
MTNNLAFSAQKRKARCHTRLLLRGALDLGERHQISKMDQIAKMY